MRSPAVRRRGPAATTADKPPVEGPRPRSWEENVVANGFGRTKNKNDEKKKKQSRRQCRRLNIPPRGPARIVFIGFAFGFFAKPI